MTVDLQVDGNTRYYLNLASIEDSKLMGEEEIA